MTPSAQEQLKAHLKVAAKIFYRDIDPTELKTFESIEKSVRQKMLEEVEPELSSFFFTSIRNGCISLLQIYKKKAQIKKLVKT